MDSSITINWESGTHFSTLLNGHQWNIDADESIGGANNGSRPMQLLLVGLAGCSGIDVCMMLKKMQVTFTHFSIVVNASTLKLDYTERYSQFNINYSFDGLDLDTLKISKAIKLSLDKYCGVAKTLEQAGPVIAQLTVNKQKIELN